MALSSREIVTLSLYQNPSPYLLYHFHLFSNIRSSVGLVDSWLFVGLSWFEGSSSETPLVVRQLANAGAGIDYMEILQVIERRRIWPCLQGPPIRISTDDFFYISTASHHSFVDRHCSACCRLWHASPPQQLLYPRFNPGIQQLPRLSAGIDPGVLCLEKRTPLPEKGTGYGRYQWNNLPCSRGITGAAGVVG